MSEQRMTTDDPAFLKHEAAFWEDRYKTQHRTVHALEDKLSLSLAREQRLREAIEEYMLWEPGRRGHAAAMNVSVTPSPLFLTGRDSE